MMKEAVDDVFALPRVVDNFYVAVGYSSKNGVATKCRIVSVRRCGNTVVVVGVDVCDPQLVGTAVVEHINEVRAATPQSHVDIGVENAGWYGARGLFQSLRWKVGNATFVDPEGRGGEKLAVVKCLESYNLRIAENLVCVHALRQLEPFDPLECLRDQLMSGEGPVHLGVWMTTLK